jgi:poly-beta-1,6-N-acetyl-D-glucosamine synthase
MAGEKFIIVTPARNEARYLGKTIQSLVSQSILPCEWVIVDDGSVDETYRIAQDAARSHPWIKVVRKENRGYRDMGRGLVESIHYGLGNISKNDFQFIFNIDADVIIGQTYFEAILNKFQENLKLGIGVGEVYDQIDNKLVKKRALPFGFNGAIKCWRRKCFEEIGGIPKGIGWDGLDCFAAMMLGWQTTTFPDEELRVFHLRPEGSSIKSQYHRWATHGKILHFAGAHPVWLLASAMYHMLDRPYVLSGFCMIIGYLEERLKGSQQYGGQEFRRFLRAWHKQELARKLRQKWMPGV